MNLRKLLLQMLHGKYYSLNQLDQNLEKYVDYDGGYYVELCANDGVNQSNSLYFERHRKWRGLLVDSSPSNFLRWRQNRYLRSESYRFVEGFSEQDYLFTSLT